MSKSMFEGEGLAHHPCYLTPGAASAGGCAASNQVLTYAVANPETVCELQPNGNYLANLGQPSATYACGRPHDTHFCAM